MNFVLRKKPFTMKKGYYCFLWNFQSIISLQTLKLALNKSMRTSANKQGINKLQPHNQQLWYSKSYSWIYGQHPVHKKKGIYWNYFFKKYLRMTTFPLHSDVSKIFWGRPISAGDLGESDAILWIRQQSSWKFQGFSSLKSLTFD